MLVVTYAIQKGLGAVKLTAAQTAEWLAARLEELGLTQEELAARAGVTAPDISRYKNHKQRPRIDQVEKIASALEVNVMDMLIGLGAIDPDAETTPRIAKGERLSTVKWVRSKSE